MLGVASVLLRACTNPKSPASPLIGLWSFDEPMAFDDLGPGGVPMTSVGTWADLATGPIIQGDAGTSAYTNGGSYATLPANQPAHALSALTISFYYQRNSAAAKQILLAAGDGSEVGDFSIEVLANGRLRGWHTGQDERLRFFEGSAGITGTNLQVGVAHRIDLSFGPQGARIYLDGAELPNAAIDAHTNGWNNARVKFLGRWTDGILSPADGVFDHLRIWNRQLLGSEITLLELAQSIELPGGAPLGEAPLVPSLAEWLRSDESDPAVTKYVSNQNRGNGSGSSAANAQEVQAALNGASSGDVLLAVSQTPGSIEFWNYPSGLNFPSGAAGNPITLQARQGDAVVVSAGEDFAGARTPAGGFWTQSGLSQADIAKNIWRSVSTFPGGSQTMMGFWIEFDHPHQIIRAGNMTNLRAPYTDTDSFTSYAGPCVHKDSDGRVYIRFQRPNTDKYSRDGTWSPNIWPNNPEAVNGSGQIVYPISQNPNDYVIHLYRVNTNQIAFDPGEAGGFIKIGAGINSMGYRDVLIGHDITMRRGTHLCWRFFVTSGNSASNKRANYDIQRVRASDGAKIHLSRREWKFGGPLEGIRSCFVEGFTDDSLSGLYFKDCTICDFHELLVAGNQHERFRFRNCTMWHIYDDGIQAFNNLSQVELGYCFLLGSAWGGMGTNGAEGNDPAPANWFIHHNIMDLREERSTNWRAQAHPKFPYLSHSPDGDRPIKIYNNLLLYGPDTENETGPGFGHVNNDTAGGRDNNLLGAANAHEVFNNMVIRVSWRGRYDPSTGYTDIGDRSDYVIDNAQCDPNSSNEFWDYNLYYRNISGTLVDGLIMRYRTSQGDSFQNFATLAAFQASALFNISKGSGSARGAYPSGFEGNSTEAKPTLASLDNFPTYRFQYRPVATAAVTVAASGSLSGANWWNGAGPSWGRDSFGWNDGAITLAPTPWKGPLDPNGSTMPVGVQNP